MARGHNRAQLIGNLGQDPELRYTQAGQPVLNLRIATTDTYLDRDKVRQEVTEWHNVTLWGKLGEALAPHLHKGSRVFVEGSIKHSSYEGRDGVKRYKDEINAQTVLLLGDGQRSDGGAPAPAERPAAPAPAAVPGGNPPPHQPSPDDDDDIPF